MLGKVKYFDSKKGYGFIIGEDEKDIFVHYSQIKVDGYKTLEKDQKVNYETKLTDKGLQAIDVTPVK